MQTRLLSVLVAILLGTGLMIAPAVTAAASPQTATCYGDYCSGMDPATTIGPNGHICSDDAYTVASNGIPGTNGTNIVELRWSPNCQSNWARANFVLLNIKAVQVSTGYQQSYSDNNGSYTWSRMIYSPTRCVKAVITGAWGSTETACV